MKVVRKAKHRLVISSKMYAILIIAIVVNLMMLIDGKLIVATKNGYYWGELETVVLLGVCTAMMIVASCLGWSTILDAKKGIAISKFHWFFITFSSSSVSLADVEKAVIASQYTHSVDSGPSHCSGVVLRLKSDDVFPVGGWLSNHSFGLGKIQKEITAFLNEWREEAQVREKGG